MNKEQVEEVVIDEELLNAKPDELKHYGVLGMKWGKRKKQENALVVVGPKKGKSDDDEKYPVEKQQKNDIVPVGNKKSGSTSKKETVEADEVIDAKFKDVKNDRKEDTPKEDPIETEINEHRTEEVRKEPRHNNNNNNNNNTNTNTNTNNNNNNNQNNNQTNNKNNNKKNKSELTEEEKEYNKQIGLQIGRLNQQAKVASGVSKASEEAAKVTQVLGKIDNDKRMRQELDSMDNATLREINTRLQLENQYKDLNKSRMAKGYDAVHKTFNLAVPVAAFVGTALSAYAQFRELRKVVK